MKVSKPALQDYAMVLLGTFMLGYAVIAFWAPHHLVTGGLSGLSIIINDYSARAGFEIPIWLANATMNVPLFVVGFRSIPRVYIVRTLVSASFLIFALWVCEFLPAPQTDLLLGSVFGGVVGGVGMGLVFRGRATTGGTALAAGILQRRVLPHLSIAKVLFGLDAIVIISGLVIFGPIAGMYAIIAIFVSTRATDTVLEGLHFAKAAFIISPHAKEIAAQILDEMDRGCTALDGRGMYSGEQKPILLCVVGTRELITLKQIVCRLDAQAFVIVADVREVLGEGFRRLEARG